MKDLIRALKEIHQSLCEDRAMAWFPEFLTADEISLDGYEVQKSDLSSFKEEYVSQACGMSGDDFHGHIVYPYKDIFIKVQFEM